MHQGKLSFFALLAIITLTASCSMAGPLDDRVLLGVGDALTKVSAPVHATVRYKNPPADLQDAALIDMALQDFTERLDPMRGYVLKARQEGRNSSVLLCDEQGQIGLIEDAGCTGELDDKIWRTQPNHPCAYVLDLAVTCPAN